MILVALLCTSFVFALMCQCLASNMDFKPVPNAPDASDNRFIGLSPTASVPHNLSANYRPLDNSQYSTRPYFFQYYIRCLF